MFQMISMGQLEELLDGPRFFTLLDVRGREEFRELHLDGAVNVPLAELESWRDPAMAAAYFGRCPVVVYCGHGAQSLMACRLLDSMGIFAVNAAGGLAYYRGRHVIAEVQENKRKKTFDRGDACD